MNKNTGIVLGILALVVLAVGAYAFMGTQDEAGAPKTTGESAVMQKENEAMMKDGDVAAEEMTKTDDATTKGSYEAYSPEKITRAETGDVVLFFHASWCPSCRALNTSIESNLSSIPGGVTVLKTDYDKETELKKKYGVTTQHTLVQVSADGTMIKKWSGGSQLENLLSQIQ